MLMEGVDELRLLGEMLLLEVTVLTTRETELYMKQLQKAHQCRGGILQVIHRLRNAGNNDFRHPGSPIAQNPSGKPWSWLRSVKTQIGDVQNQRTEKGGRKQLTENQWFVVCQCRCQGKLSQNVTVFCNLQNYRCLAQHQSNLYLSLMNLPSHQELSIYVLCVLLNYLARSSRF